jgi:hypothetical protein
MYFSLRKKVFELICQYLTHLGYLFNIQYSSLSPCLAENASLKLGRRVKMQKTVMPQHPQHIRKGINQL